MNRALEFHDSVVAEVVEANGVVVLSLRDAYVHMSRGTPGVDAGDGYMEPLDITLLRASCRGDIALASGAISHGELRVDGKPVGLSPLPLSVAGTIEVDLVFTSGNTLFIRAHKAISSSRGPARWVESYEGD